MNDTITTSEIADQIIEAIQDKKGSKIKIIDLSGIETAGIRRFIICEGRSTAQVAGIADSVREYVFTHTGRKPYNYDGYKNSQWIAIDYGDTMVHVFTPDTRQRYNLEELWSDGHLTEIPDQD